MVREIHPDLELQNYNELEQMEVREVARFKRPCLCGGEQHFHPTDSGVNWDGTGYWICAGTFKSKQIVIPGGEKAHQVEQRYLQIIRVAEPCKGED